jgi:hypothetical protein
MDQFETGSASKAYARVAQVVMDPRDLEASSVLKAAAKLHSGGVGPKAPVRACRRFAVQSPPLDRVH